MINADRWELRERQWSARVSGARTAVLTMPTMRTVLTMLTGPATSTTSSSTYAMPTPPKGSGQRPEKVAEGAQRAPAPVAQQTMVLVAEDEESIAETLSLIVEDAGYIPVVAYDGREALALARQHHPHLIITDLMMPYVSGTELIAAVRADADAQNLAPPAIMVVTAASRAYAREAGADAVIGKPFDVATIESVMRQLIQQRQG